MATEKQILKNAREIAQAQATLALQNQRKAIAEQTKTKLEPSVAVAQKLVNMVPFAASTYEKLTKKAAANPKLPKSTVQAFEKFATSFPQFQAGAATAQETILTPYQQALATLGEAPVTVPSAVYETIREEERTLARETFKNTLALFFGTAEAAKPWTDALYNTVSKFYKTGSNIEESFNLALLDARNNPDLKPFTDRFKGIYALQDLRQAGKPVLVPTIAEYVVSQAKMADILKQANLGDIATEEFTGDLIGKGNSVSNIADKVAQVYNRIDYAPKDIKDTFARFFPTVDRPTLARTILLGEKGVQQLVDELGKYEVLAAAERQGIAATPERLGGLTVERAGEYARMGETFSSIMPKLARVAQATPVISKLSGVSKRADIGQAGVESAVIKGTAAELEEIQRLSEEEEARFRARAGRAETGLASQRRANRAF